MAIIQSIRNKYGKLAGGVIALALVGFILMDAFSGRFGDMMGRDNNVAKVNGEKITTRDFSTRVKEYETLYTIFSKGKPVDDNARAELSAQALQNMVYEKVAERQCEKLGLETTKEEQKEIIYGAFPDQLVQQFPAFTDEKTGQFDPQRIKGLEQQAASNANLRPYLEQWQNVKEYVIRNNTVTKLNVMIAASTYIPKFLIDKTIKDQSTKASIQFVKVPYISVSDNEVKITDEDINIFVRKHSAGFNVDEQTRSIDYVSFDIQPSHDDTAKVLENINKAKAELVAATDKTIENVVNRNSDDHYVNAYYNKRTFKSRLADTILSQPVGTVYGPYLDNGSYKVTRVISKQQLPDTVKVRHILVWSKSHGKDVRSDSAAKRIIDSVETALKGGADFKTLMAKYTDDTTSKATNGEYTFEVLQRGSLSKEFGDEIFEGRTGDKKVVHVSNDNYTGYHYIEVLEQKGINTTAKLATISKELAPSNETQNAAYAKANEFAGKNTTAAAFDDAVKKENLNKKIGDGIKAGDFVIQGLGPSREIIRWMYDAKMGDVSNVFSLDSRYVVAKLSSKQDKGLMQVTPMIRPRLENAVRQEKKAELIAAKYKNMTSLDAISKAVNIPIAHADSFSIGSAYNPGLGYDIKAIGYSFNPGLLPGRVSPGVRGGDGVLFINVINRWSSPLDPNTTNMLYGQQRTMQERQQKNVVNEQLRPELIKSADVKYTPKNI
ncbi:MAG: SurA N-terminal domain-containing protein [Taibaiella sp.]|nr:SurA N-terminal domain-containing protein [Taibaiella sp.]